MTKQMPEAWTGQLIGLMHNERITYDQIAEQMGVTKSYLSMIFNGKRNPPDAKERISAAIEAVRKNKAQDTVGKEG